MALLGLRLSGFRNGVSRLHRHGLAPAVGIGLAAAARSNRSRSLRSPTASTCRPGFRTKWATCTTATWARLARRPGRQRVVAGSTTSRTRNSGALTNASANASSCARAPAARRRLDEPRPIRPRPACGCRWTRDALTIGFARRFASYKRATLLFRDPERLARIVNDARPAGAVRLRREGAPAGRAGQGAHPRSCRAQLPARIPGPARSFSNGTTSNSRGRSSRAATSGSTRRYARWRRAGRAA